MNVDDKLAIMTEIIFLISAIIFFLNNNTIAGELSITNMFLLGLVIKR